MRGRVRAGALRALRWTVGLLALWWAASQVPLGPALARLSTVGPGTVAVVLGVTVVGLVGRFDTWRTVLAPTRRVSLLVAARVDLVVNFVNQVLPSRLSGRVAAPFVVRSETGVSASDATAVSVVHTGVYAVYYGVTAAAGLVVAALGAVGGPLLGLLGLSTGLYLVAGVTVLAGGANAGLVDSVAGRLAAALARVPRVGTALADRVREAVAVADASTGAVRSRLASPTVWGRYGVGWTVALVVAPGVRVGALFAALGASVDPLVLPLYVVAAYSVTLLPVTPGGVGVTEATATAVFGALGVPAAVAVPAVVLDRTLGVYLPALAGWYPSLGLDVRGITAD